MEREREEWERKKGGDAWRGKGESRRKEEGRNEACKEEKRSCRGSLERRRGAQQLVQ